MFLKKSLPRAQTTSDVIWARLCVLADSVINVVALQ